MSDKKSILLRPGLFISGIMICFLLCSCSQKVQGSLEINANIISMSDPAFSAVVAPFEKKYPGVTIIPSPNVSLESRLRGGLPPDVFFTYGGRSFLETYDTDGRLSDLTPLAQEEGWEKHIPPEVTKYLTKNGSWRLAPVGVHRSTLLMYAPEKLKQCGIAVPGTWDEFISAAVKLRSQGITPLLMHPGAELMVCFESVALSELGPERWQAIWDGRWAADGPEMANVWRKFKAVLDACGDYINPSVVDLDGNLGPDTSAFVITTDAPSRFSRFDRNLAAGYSWTAAPGTENLFVFYVDGFAIPRGAENPAAARAWLAWVAAPEGQNAFNGARGTASIRSDANQKGLTDYGLEAARDYREKRLIGSLAFGMVTGEAFIIDLAMAMPRLIHEQTPGAAAQAFSALMKKHRITQ